MMQNILFRLAENVILDSLDVVWKGMAGIFIITGIIILCVYLLGKILPNKK